MARDNPEVYHPTSPPIEFPDWHRWIDGELSRIALSLAANPIIMTVANGGLPIGIDTTPTTVIIGINDAALFDFPGGAWDPATAEYTVGQGGLYTVQCQVFLDAFGPGNKSYHATLEVFVNNITRAVQLTGGADDVPLAVNLNNMLILEVEDLVRVELTVVHEQFTGATTYSYSLSYLRQAGST